MVLTVLYPSPLIRLQLALKHWQEEAAIREMLLHMFTQY